MKLVPSTLRITGRLVPTTLRITGRRVVAIAVAAVAGLAISTAAYAATSSGTSSGTASTAAASIPRCTASDLGVWLAVGQGNGAAGTIYYPLEFTNLSHHTCYLFGYPGVSALSRNGNQLGSPASWGSLRGARIVNLAPGATAHTILAYHDAVVSTEPGCDPVNLAANLPRLPARSAQLHVRRLFLRGLLARRTDLDEHHRADHPRRGHGQRLSRHVLLTPPRQTCRGGVSFRRAVPGRTPGSAAWSAAGTPRTGGTRRPLAPTTRHAPRR